MTYWEERAATAAARAEKAVDGYLLELVKAFEQSKRELRQEIEAFYGRYAKANRISLSEAQVALSYEELRQFRSDLKAYEKLAKSSIGTYDLQLENLSIRARVTRLEALQLECETILQRLYQEQRRGIERTVEELYRDSYYRRLFEMEQAAGRQIPFAQITDDAIQQVLRYPVSGADLSTRLWRQDMDTGFKIRETLNEMFTTGKPPQYFAQELQRVIGVLGEDGKPTGKQYEAYRVLYNEASFAMEQAHFAAYEEDGVEEYEFIATLSEKTCPVCGELDGKVFRVSERRPGVNSNPMHVNCHCTTAPHIPGLDESVKRTRTARDPVTGKSVAVEAQTYEEWRKERVDKYGADAVTTAERRARNENADFKQYQKYRNTIGKEAPESFAKFQELKYTDNNGYNELKGLYRYKSAHPQSELIHYKISRELQSLGVNIGAAISPNNLKGYVLEDIGAKEPAHVLKRMFERHITADDVQKNIDNALIAFEQWNGTRMAFYSENGVTVVAKHGDGWIVKTAWGKNDFDEQTEQIIRVVKKYVK